MKEVKLDSNLHNIIATTNYADISVVKENTNNPYILYDGEFYVNNENQTINISEKENCSNNGINVKLSNNEAMSISLSNCSIHNLTIADGQTININSQANQSKRQLDIILPSSNNLSLNVLSNHGNILVANLIFQKLYLKTEFGSITAKDLDALNILLQSTYGDIYAEIRESIINYKTYLNSKFGNVMNSSNEQVSPSILSEKHNLDADSKFGNVRILFKGK